MIGRLPRVHQGQKCVSSHCKGAARFRFLCLRTISDSLERPNCDAGRAPRRARIRKLSLPPLFRPVVSPWRPSMAQPDRSERQQREGSPIHQPLLVCVRRTGRTGRTGSCSSRSTWNAMSPNIFIHLPFRSSARLRNACHLRTTANMIPLLAR